MIENPTTPQMRTSSSSGHKNERASEEKTDRNPREKAENCLKDED